MLGSAILAGEHFVFRSDGPLSTTGEAEYNNVHLPNNLDNFNVLIEPEPVTKIKTPELRHIFSFFHNSNAIRTNCITVTGVENTYIRIHNV